MEISDKIRCKFVQASPECQKPILKEGFFQFVLKSVMHEVVNTSAGREFHAA